MQLITNEADYHLTVFWLQKMITSLLDGQFLSHEANIQSSVKKMWKRKQVKISLATSVRAKAKDEFQKNRKS